MRGTEEAIRQEFESVFGGLRGMQGDQMRDRVGLMREEVWRDMEDGQSRDDWERLIEF